LKKTFWVTAKNGKINIHFPKISSGQAILSAIAIATLNKKLSVSQKAPRNIQQLSLHSPTQNECKIGTWLDLYSKQYSDSEVAFTQLPSELFDADYIQFSKKYSDKNTGSFVSKEEANVYVFLDNTTTSHLDWLSNYKKLEQTAKNSLGTVFSIYSKKVKKGETVFFGENPENSAMYSIAVVPTYVMGEVDDSRPIVLLEAENAKVTGEGVVKGNFKKSDYVEFTQSISNSIQFEVKPGVAGIYLMRFKYMNLTDKSIKLNLKIVDANGILLKNDSIEFSAAADKWKIVNTTSGGYINAGTYTISLESNEMKGLRLDSLEFQ